MPSNAQLCPEIGEDPNTDDTRGDFNSVLDQTGEQVGIRNSKLRYKSKNQTQGKQQI